MASLHTGRYVCLSMLVSVWGDTFGTAVALPFLRLEIFVGDAFTHRAPFKKGQASWGGRVRRY